MAEHQDPDDPTGVKAALLSNVSHELRTPLNGIVGFAEMLADEVMGPIGADQREALEHILACARHLTQMVDDVLALSDVTAGRMIRRPRPVALSRLCQEVCDTAWPPELRTRRLDLSVDPEVERVVLDPDRFSQVLYNFVSNALKFTPEQGHVSVRITPDGTGELRVQIRDTGIGIDPNDFGRLFVPFGQLDSGRGKSFQGLGLGLALTKRIVEQQGGRVGVESRLGEGSTFFAVLPYQSCQVSELSI
jgi:signal transduction histidine kinase